MMEKDRENISKEEEVSEEEVSEEIYHSSDDYYWLKVEDGNLRIGFTPIGAEVHGVKSISIKPIGIYLAKDAAFAGYMGIAAGGLYMPISGKIIDLNFDLRGNPNLVNSDPEDSGWLIKVEPSKFEEEVEQLEKVITEEPVPEESSEEDLDAFSEKEIKKE
ncbi:hypothetical protein ACFLY8_02735 [Halobacteriota archaeon]